MEPRMEDLARQIIELAATFAAKKKEGPGLGLVGDPLGWFLALSVWFFSMFFFVFLLFSMNFWRFLMVFRGVFVFCFVVPIFFGGRFRVGIYFVLLFLEQIPLVAVGSRDGSILKKHEETVFGIE